MSSCRIHGAVPRFRDPDGNRPVCTCVRSLEKLAIQFTISDQAIVAIGNVGWRRSNASMASFINLIFLTTLFPRKNDSETATKIFLFLV